MHSYKLQPFDPVVRLAIFFLTGNPDHQKYMSIVVQFFWVQVGWGIIDKNYFIFLFHVSEHVHHLKVRYLFFIFFYLKIIP
jgi:hypothetical protein